MTTQGSADGHATTKSFNKRVIIDAQNAQRKVVSRRTSTQETTIHLPEKKVLREPSNYSKSPWKVQAGSPNEIRAKADKVVAAKVELCQIVKRPIVPISKPLNIRVNKPDDDC